MLKAIDASGSACEHAGQAGLVAKAAAGGYSSQIFSRTKDVLASTLVSLSWVPVMMPKGTSLHFVALTHIRDRDQCRNFPAC